MAATLGCDVIAIRARLGRINCLTPIPLSRLPSQLSLVARQPSHSHEDQFSKWLEFCLSALAIEGGNLQPVQLPDEFSSAKGCISKGNEVTFDVTAFQSKKLSYIRRVSFKGEGYNVFNFIAFPRANYDLPILGIDVVSLPGSTLASVDFQPLSNADDYFQSDLYQPFKCRLSKWATVLPEGGPLPDSFKPFFSPLALWSKFPSERNAAQMFLVEQAIKDYVTCYRDLLIAATPQQDRPAIVDRERALESYLLFRIANDPAKRMLTAAFGAGWTADALQTVVFPAANSFSLR